MDIGVFGNPMDPCVASIKKSAERMGASSKILDLRDIRKKRFAIMVNKKEDGIKLRIGDKDIEWLRDVETWYVRQIPLKVAFQRPPDNLKIHNKLVKYEPEWASIEESLIRTISHSALVVNPLRTQILQYQKTYQHHILSKNGLPVPEWRVEMPMEEYYSEGSGSGKWVLKAHSIGKAVREMSHADIENTKRDDPWTRVPPIIQKKIAGEPIRVAAVEEEVIGAYAIKTEKLDVREGFLQGAARAERIEPDEELTELAIRTLEALGLFFSEIDMIKNADGLFVLEGNPSPGFAFSETVGIPVSERLIAHMIERAKR